MKNIKTIFILVLSLILLFAVSCSNDDKTGVKNNPPENDTEITDGETGSGGTGSSSGGSSETEEGGDGTETPPTPTDPETPTEPETEEGYFPPPAGNYSDDKVVSSGYTGDFYNTVVSNNEATKKTTIEGYWIKDGTDRAQKKNFSIEKWTKTTKGGKTIKLEGEYVNGEEKYTIIYDYASETLSGTYAHSDGTKASFNGKKIS